MYEYKWRPSAPTSINDLPDELLLQIGAQFTNLDRNSDLARLALVSQKWRNVAQEWLLKLPRFNLRYIDQYLWELAHHERLQPQVRSLEIWSNSNNRLPRDGAGKVLREYRPTLAPRGWDPSFVDKCHELIRHFGADRKSSRRWATALRDDCVPALFAMMICVLPNLTHLKLGNTWLMDLPIFCRMVSCTDGLSTIYPLSRSEHKFLRTPFEQMLSRLEILEVPADMSCTLFISMSSTSVFSFVGFKNLKEIGITMKALWWIPRPNRPPMDPRELFPTTLEVLRISEATLATRIYLRSVCAARRGGHFPALRRVEVYYMESLAKMKQLSPLRDPVVDLQHIFKQAETAIYMYFPAHELKTWEVGCTPWQLRQDREAFRNFQLSVFKLYPGWCRTDVEAEFEMDGDTVMRDLSGGHHV